MNDIIAAAEARIPPFFFHYIIVVVCVIFITCVAVLKFKYLYWYSQPLTFRFTLRRFWGGDRGGLRRQASSIMNPLSIGNRCYTAVVYPFLNHVNHENVKVVDATDDTEIAAAAAAAAIHHFERIAGLLSRPEKEIMAPGRIRENVYMEWGCISSDTLRIILSQPTFGLSPFIGILHRPHDVAADAAAAAIKGVAVVTPRIMMSFDGGSPTSPVLSVSIYMCEYLAWERYTTSERESLELLETTEYIQKSREIAGEQTLYRYCEIPWFVIPFTTVYTYTFRMPANATNAAAMAHLGNGMSVVRVSSANMALFYSFVNECSRDFRCCIFNEFTQLQSLVTHGIYRIYLLLFNQVRVAAAYIFAPSGMTAATAAKHSSSSSMRRKTGKNSTKANRISELHEHISNTSTALVKYMPPVRTPQYDAFGKRVSRESVGSAAAAAPGQRNGDDSILLLISSIQHRSLCDKSDFVNGFYSAAATAAATSTSVSPHYAKTNPCLVMIDTMAHNYRLIDDISKSTSSSTMTTPTNPTGAYQLLSQDKWYYILYNAIIHEETVCKDILLI